MSEMSKTQRMIFVILVIIVMLISVAAMCGETCVVVSVYQRADGKSVKIVECCNPDGVCTRHEELVTK